VLFRGTTFFDGWCLIDPRRPLLPPYRDGSRSGFPRRASGRVRRPWRRGLAAGGPRSLDVRATPTIPVHRASSPAGARRRSAGDAMHMSTATEPIGGRMHVV